MGCGLNLQDLQQDNLQHVVHWSLQALLQDLHHLMLFQPLKVLGFNGGNMQPLRLLLMHKEALRRAGPLLA